MVRHSSDLDLNEKDVKLLETLERWGWFVTKVGASGSEPAFAYSMGLYENFKHPEIILFGLGLEVMHQLINDVGKRIQQGQRYDEAQKNDDLLKGYTCEFRKVNPIHYNGLLNYAIWYYKGSSFPVLQLIWPDPAGCFPWEDGFDERFRKKQPRLE
jgi:Domain of unknown function (DUF4262)